MKIVIELPAKIKKIPMSCKDCKYKTGGLDLILTDSWCDDDAIICTLTNKRLPLKFGNISYYRKHRPKYCPLKIK